MKRRIELSNISNIKPLLIDCHSFSNERFLNDGVLNDNNKDFPDICIGYNENIGKNTELIDYITNEFIGLGYKVEHNYPYNGSLYYEDLNHDTIMLEINKKLYLDESNNKRPDFYKIKNIINHIINNLLY